MCGLRKADFAYNVIAGSGSSRTEIKMDNGFDDGFFTQGTMMCTSGENVGVSRSIKWFSGNSAIPAQPFANDVRAGDRFTFWRGCAKTMVACQGYNNMANFRGFPFLPCQNVLL
jgi:uncharacterized phage protein (TIGR02218 family)